MFCRLGREGKMKLEEGEVFCPKCNGGGSYPYKFVKLEDPKYCRCNKCLGTGKLDWIEMCVGKKSYMYIKPGVYTQEIDFSEYIRSEVNNVCIIPRRNL